MNLPCKGRVAYSARSTLWSKQVDCVEEKRKRKGPGDRLTTIYTRMKIFQGLRPVSMMTTLRSSSDVRHPSYSGVVNDVSVGRFLPGNLLFPGKWFFRVPGK